MPAAGDTASRRWSRVELVGFRFAFAYALLFYPILAVHDLPLFAWVDDLWNAVWARVVPWTARHVFGVQRDFTDTTDGLIDCRYSYARVACVALFAGVVALVWSLRDRGARDHMTLRECLRVLLRYGLANAMLSYGLAKVFEHQFHAPSLERLVEPYGDQTAQSVLWNFMGASRPYSIFCGLAECLGGVLLLFRRTATLGALVTAAVMANVVMLNLSYDVPVKLYSLHLFLMAIFLASFEGRRIVDALVLQRATAPLALPPHFVAPRWSRAATLAKVVVLLYLALVLLHRALIEWRPFAEAAPNPSLYGIWEVTSRPERLAWTRLVIDRSKDGTPNVAVSLWRADGSHEPLRGTEDDDRRTLLLASSKETEPATRLSYVRVDDDHLVLTTDGDGVAARFELQRRDVASFPLAQWRFRWSRGDFALSR
jgi:uncharacterized membrane protein YphA (DoxX/SURF4 family)